VDDSVQLEAQLFGPSRWHACQPFCQALGGRVSAVTSHLEFSLVRKEDTAACFGCLALWCCPRSGERLGRGNMPHD
jgi:hypothetical protein